MGSHVLRQALPIGSVIEFRYECLVHRLDCDGVELRGQSRVEPTNARFVPKGTISRWLRYQPLSGKTRPESRRGYCVGRADQIDLLKTQVEEHLRKPSGIPADRFMGSRPRVAFGALSMTELHIRNTAAQTRIVSGGQLWPGGRELSRYFKYMARVRIPEFESYMPSHAVGSARAEYECGSHPSQPVTVL